MPALLTSVSKIVSIIYILLGTLILTRFTSERTALRWVQKYISAFGGDPKKVTMYVILFPLIRAFAEHSSCEQLGPECRRYLRLASDARQQR